MTHSNVSADNQTASQPDNHPASPPASPPDQQLEQQFDQQVDKLLNQQLGTYQIRALLGKGGMARVYRAYDSTLDREVAIKVIRTEAETPEYIKRFRREARVAANLRHPNIVQVYQLGEQDGIIYMVQELLPGPTLEQFIRDQSTPYIPAEHVLAIMTQMARAIDFAHQHSVLHRDIKPSNALYNAVGEIVLTDFGLARNLSDTSYTTTKPGMVMGTPGYIAPEQAISSAAITKAVDIYALGVVLFELLTARLPFEADTPMGVVLKHLYDETPAPSTLRPDLPPTVDQVVLQATAKEPAERFATAEALASALADAWQRSPAATPPPLPAAPAAPAAQKPAARRAPSRPQSRPPQPPPPPADTPPPPAEDTLRLDPDNQQPTDHAVRSTPRQGTPAPADTPHTNRRARMARLRTLVLLASIVGLLLLIGFELQSGLVSQSVPAAWESLRRLLGL